jgi:hypothetical protein
MEEIIHSRGCLKRDKGVSGDYTQLIKKNIQKEAELK